MPTTDPCSSSAANANKPGATNPTRDSSAPTHGSAEPTLDRSHILITASVRSRQEFFDEIAAALYPAAHGKRPAPTNLDGLADILKEFAVTRIICADTVLPPEDDEALRRVFAALGVCLVG